MKRGMWSEYKNKRTFNALFLLGLEGSCLESPFLGHNLKLNFKNYEQNKLIIIYEFYSGVLYQKFIFKYNKIL